VTGPRHVWPLLALLLMGVGLMVALLLQPTDEVRLSAYATSLQGRTRGQRHNATLSLKKLDGAAVPPGATFSFNDVVGTWSRDAGYVRAPVSYNGQLITSWGGGVCQTSTTLYNAALLAGMEITERHRHRFAPSYVPPGRDAAVAYSDIDLAFRNPHPWPVRIGTRVENGRLVVEFYGERALEGSIAVVQQVAESTPPAEFIARGPRQEGRLLNPGKRGFQVATWRITRSPSGIHRELLSEDVYPAMARIVAEGE